ncbi:MAG: H(+)-transporting ATPase [Ruminococcus sp.]|nr:H(+)-transporting ATPase [Ruminococcus sp.]
MAGIDEILDIIGSQQKQTEESIISAAQKKAERITEDGRVKAEAAYSESLERSREQLARDHENACASADAEIKRRLLAFKVGCVDDAVEKTLEKLDKLPDKEYFALILRLLKNRLRDGKGVLSLSKRDLDRLPDSFRKELDSISGGSVSVSDKAADIKNGFILTYGLISENCSFRAIAEAEREGIRDTAARALFGQVKS